MGIIVCFIIYVLLYENQAAYSYRSILTLYKRVTITETTNQAYSS